MEDLREKDMSPDSDWGVIYSNRFKINTEQKKRFIIVDDFYEDVDAVRDFALKQYFFDDEGYLGMRTRKQHFFDGVKERFEELLGMEIISPDDWEDYGMNGRFQSCIAGQSRVFHCDQQRFAAIVYLTPNAPVGSGTSTFQHKESKVFHSQQRTPEGKTIDDAFNQHTFVDSFPYELMDHCANVYNRLVIFDARLIHSPDEYFGHNIETGRLFQMFFFDARSRSAFDAPDGAGKV
tara:strand:- start:463 stop:1167 length:705 start_codon:yes stop_codon:yes gene_type:complete